MHTKEDKSSVKCRLSRQTRWSKTGVRSRLNPGWPGPHAQPRIFQRREQMKDEGCFRKGNSLA